MSVRASSYIILFTLLILCAYAVGCSSTDKQVSAYADNFYDNLDKEIDTCNTFISAYENADFNTEYGIYSFQKTLTIHLRTFNDFLNFYQSTYPNSAPQDLKDAVSFARDGTTEAIAGITTINIAITNSSNSQLISGLKMFNASIDKINQARTKYNSFADSFNAKSNSGSTNFGLGILIGTGILWSLGLLIVNPLASLLTKRKFALQYVDGYLPQDDHELSEKVNSIYNRTYILVDLIVLSTAGFLMGLLVGWYFIGISWRARDWPGLIAFIGFSFLGSFLHG